MDKKFNLLFKDPNTFLSLSPMLQHHTFPHETLRFNLHIYAEVLQVVSVRQLSAAKPSKQLNSPHRTT